MQINPVYADMGTTIFEHTSALCRETGAINLGQGFPDHSGPAELIEAAARALRDKSNQYPPGLGIPELRDAICDFYRHRQGMDLSREQVVVTSGATEAIAVALLALVHPGDEVILFQPAYDAYAPMVRRAGGVPVSVALSPPDWRYPVEALTAAITPRTRLLMLNDPLNPAGTVASEAELAAIAKLCAVHDLVAICDEVWEEVRFDGLAHRSLMTFPGMAERTVKIGSAGKIFGLTGWKVGWMVAAPQLAAGLARAHQFVTFTTPPALQWAVAEGLALPDAWFAARTAGWAASRQQADRGADRCRLCRAAQCRNLVCLRRSCRVRHCAGRPSLQRARDPRGGGRLDPGVRAVRRRCPHPHRPLLLHQKRCHDRPGSGTAGQLPQLRVLKSHSKFAKG